MGYLRLAVSIKSKKKRTFQKMKKKMPMDTKLWRKLRSTYASYQQRLISLGDLLRSLQQKKDHFLLNNEKLFLKI